MVSMLPLRRLTSGAMVTRLEVSMLDSGATVGTETTILAVSAGADFMIGVIVLFVRRQSFVSHALIRKI